MKDNIRLISFGDTLLEENMFENDSFNEILDYIKDGDIITFNLETVVSDSKGDQVDKAFNFKTKSSALKELKNQLNENQIICNISNNHIMDFGISCLRETIENLNEYNMPYVGFSESLSVEDGIYFLNIKNKCIGFIGAFGMYNVTRNDPGLTSLDSTLLSKVEYAKSKCDYLIIHLHWGEELSLSPTPKQIKFAHDLIDNGVDVIIGHHPHVIQSVERYKNGIIAYSLGNFQMITYDYNDYTNYGAMLELIIDDDKIEYSLKPIYITNRVPRIINDINTDQYIKFNKIVRQADYYLQNNNWFNFLMYSSKPFLIDSLQAWKRRFKKGEKKLLIKITRWLLSKKTLIMIAFLPLNILFLNRKMRKVL